MSNEIKKWNPEKYTCEGEKNSVIVGNRRWGFWKHFKLQRFQFWLNEKNPVEKEFAYTRTRKQDSKNGGKEQDSKHLITG